MKFPVFYCPGIMVTNNNNKMKNVGGQAVIEGVMMKASKNWTVAVRDKEGSIHLKRERLTEHPRFLRLPIVRGVVSLFQAITLGIRAIEFSASKAYDEGTEKKLGNFTLVVTISIAILLGIGLFILVPLYVTKLIGIIVHDIATNSLLFNFTDGIIRVMVFLIYIILIGTWKEMARIFKYHGAEHKVIHTYEEGRELTLHNAKNYSPLHPRCGTSFLMIVMLVSILVFSFIPQHWPFLQKFSSRIVLIPVIAGLSFEFLKLSSNWKDNPLVNLLIQPGLLLQRLTTREPDETEIEVALNALLEVLRLEQDND